MNGENRRYRTLVTVCAIVIAAGIVALWACRQWGGTLFWALVSGGF
jgi:hypothetical protein